MAQLEYIFWNTKMYLSVGAVFSTFRYSLGRTVENQGGVKQARDIFFAFSAFSCTSAEGRRNVVMPNGWFTWYQVKDGDTLSGIALYWFGNGTEP